MPYSTQVKLKPGMDPGTDLDTYLLLCPEFVCDIGLPLGAVLTRDTEKSVVITLPRMNFFDVWLQPIANAGVRCSRRRSTIYLSLMGV